MYCRPAHLRGKERKRTNQGRGGRSLDEVLRLFLHFCSLLREQASPLNPKCSPFLQWCSLCRGCSLCWGGMRGVFGAVRNPQRNHDQSGRNRAPSLGFMFSFFFSTRNRAVLPLGLPVFFLFSPQENNSDAPGHMRGADDAPTRPGHMNTVETARRGASRALEGRGWGGGATGRARISLSHHTRVRRARSQSSRPGGWAFRAGTRRRCRRGGGRRASPRGGVALGTGVLLRALLLL